MKYTLVLGLLLKPNNALATEALFASKVDEELLDVLTKGDLLMIFSTSSSSLSVNSSWTEILLVNDIRIASNAIWLKFCCTLGNNFGASGMILALLLIS